VVVVGAAVEGPVGRAAGGVPEGIGGEAGAQRRAAGIDAERRIEDRAVVGRVVGVIVAADADAGVGLGDGDGAGAGLVVVVGAAVEGPVGRAAGGVPEGIGGEAGAQGRAAGIDAERRIEDRAVVGRVVGVTVAADADAGVGLGDGDGAGAGLVVVVGAAVE